MKANEVVEMLSERDIISLLEDLGGDPKEHGNNIFSKTVCHHGDKHKLIYFKDSKTFKCFTGTCGTMDIFGVVSKSLNLEFFESFKYICSKFGISYQLNETYGFDEKVDTSFFKNFNKKKEEISLTKYPKTILNYFHSLYHQLWINDGISINTMKRFGIRFDISKNQIIIPHFDLESNLIGVRARNLNEQEVEDGKKYMPIYYKNQVLKHPTGANLYGLNLNRDQIEFHRKIILVESEKAVMQLDAMFPDMSIAVCISGSSLTTYQLEILKYLEIEEVIVAADKEFEELGSDEEKFYAQKITSVFVDKLLPYFQTSVIWDLNNLLNYKDSPMDQGKEVFLKLFNSRIRF